MVFRRFLKDLRAEFKEMDRGIIAIDLANGVSGPPPSPETWSNIDSSRVVQRLRDRITNAIGDGRQYKIGASLAELVRDAEMVPVSVGMSDEVLSIIQTSDPVSYERILREREEFTELGRSALIAFLEASGRIEKK